METVLFLSAAESGRPLGKSALEALEVAESFVSTSSDAELVVGLVGEDVGEAANSVASCGAKRFIGVNGSAFSQPRYASDAAAAEAVCREAEATIVIAPGDSRWFRVLSGVAFRLNGRVDSHITGIAFDDCGISVTRWYYRQRMEAVLTRTHRPWFILVDPGSCKMWDGEAGNASLENLSVELTETALRTRVSGIQEPPIDEQTIRPDAELLFVAGAGWTKKQADGEMHISNASELILDFMKKTDSSLGSSKSLVDMDTEGQGVLPFLSHLNQVGQTGATPRHPKGLATCCHGEEPHVVGWRFINERWAVNLDPNCGWAQGKADVLYVADAFEVMEKVNALLAEE